MDMSTTSSSMAITMRMPSSTSTGTTMSATSASMAGMDMGGGCKIAMTWNWYTVGACFIAKTWQITSAGMFAGSCIGVIFLVISLEFLRRIQREYDAYIRRQDQQVMLAAITTQAASSSTSSMLEAINTHHDSKSANAGTQLLNSSTTSSPLQVHHKRVTLLKRQAIRSLIHMVQFAVAYFIMLLAMYYNGYIIICIIVGAFLGFFIFSWDQMLDKTRTEAADVTGCCG